MKKEKKTNKKLFSALAMFLISTAMLGTATYAWFTMSRTVKVDGMEVKTKVMGNLLISDSNTSDAYYGTQLTQAVKALLEPVSTINGTDASYYYTLDAKADGSKLHDTTTSPFIKYDTTGQGAATDTTNYANKFSEDYSVTKSVAGNLVTGKDRADGYIDYVFYLKAVPDDANNELRMTRCNLAYNGAAIDNTGASGVTDYDKAWRVAVFAQETTVGVTDATPSTDAGNLKGSILGLTDAAYFDGKAVSSTTATAATNVNNSPVVIDTGLASGTPKYYKVVVRLWLEGQDTACKTETYVDLTNAWNLDLQFDLVPSGDTSTPAVAQIRSAAPATVVDDVPRASNP